MTDLQKRAEGYCNHNVPKGFHEYGLQIFKDAFREGEMEQDKLENRMLIVAAALGGAFVGVIVIVFTVLKDI